MQRWALAFMVAACSGGRAPIEPDASMDAIVIPPSSEYWPCYFWDDVSETVTRCSPNCSNATLLGREVWGDGNTCEYAPGASCPVEHMTGPSHSTNAGCCVYVDGANERVEFVDCL